MAQTQETRFDAIESSLAALKAVKDPAVQAEAEKLEKNVKEIIALNKPIIVDYAEQIKKFDQSVVSKYGLQVARVIEFGMIALVAAKIYFLG